MTNEHTTTEPADPGCTCHIRDTGCATHELRRSGSLPRLDDNATAIYQVLNEWDGDALVTIAHAESLAQFLTDHGVRATSTTPSVEQIAAEVLPYTPTLTNDARYDMAHKIRALWSPAPGDAAEVHSLAWWRQQCSEQEALRIEATERAECAEARVRELERERDNIGCTRFTCASDLQNAKERAEKAEARVKELEDARDNLPIRLNGRNIREWFDLASEQEKRAQGLAKQIKTHALTNGGCVPADAHNELAENYHAEVERLRAALEAARRAVSKTNNEMQQAANLAQIEKARIEAIRAHDAAEGSAIEARKAFDVAARAAVEADTTEGN